MYPLGVERETRRGGIEVRIKQAFVSEVPCVRFRKRGRERQRESLN